MPGEFYIEGKKEKFDLSQLVAAAAELEDKLDSIVVYRGETTGDGAVDGSTLVCSDLATKPDYDGNLVVVKSGTYAGQASQINGDTTGGTVTAHTHFGGQIANGVSFAVLGLRVSTAAIAAIDTSDAVWVDMVNGFPGTGFPIGTPVQPVNNIADLVNIVSTRHLHKVVVIGVMNISDADALPAGTFTGIKFIGVTRGSNTGSIGKGSVIKDSSTAGDKFKRCEFEHLEFDYNKVDTNNLIFRDCNTFPIGVDVFGCNTAEFIDCGDVTLGNVAAHFWIDPVTLLTNDGYISFLRCGRVISGDLLSGNLRIKDCGLDTVVNSLVTPSVQTANITGKVDIDNCADVALADVVGDIQVKNSHSVSWGTILSSKMTFSNNDDLSGGDLTATGKILIRQCGKLEAGIVLAEQLVITDCGDSSGTGASIDITSIETGNITVNSLVMRNVTGIGAGTISANFANLRSVDKFNYSTFTILDSCRIVDCPDNLDNLYMSGAGRKIIRGCGYVGIYGLDSDVIIQRCGDVEFYGMVSGAVVVNSIGGHAVNVYPGAVGGTVDVYGNAVISSAFGGGTIVNDHTLGNKIDALVSSGLAVRGTVSVNHGVSQTECADLIGHGETYFKYWRVWVLWDAGGLSVAPQNESAEVSGYVSSTGVIDFFPVMTAAPDVGDKILLVHPSVGSLLAYIKAIDAAATSAAAYAIVNSGLSFRANVTSKAGCGANDFICGSLAGVGTGAFADAVAPYRCFVLRDAGRAGAAPQGETQSVEAYDSATGKFTTNPFTTTLEVGDNVIIMHPRIAELAAILHNVIGFPSTGIYSHPDGLGKSDALVFLAANQDIDVRFDMNGFAQNVTITEEEQIDAVNYRILSAKIFPTDFDTGTKAVWYAFRQANALYKITFQSAVAEGASVNVPYRKILKDLS